MRAHGARSCRLIVARCTGRDRASRCAHPLSSGEHSLGRRNAHAAESRPNARLLAAGLRGPVVCDGGVSRTQGRPCRPARCASSLFENAAQRPGPRRHPDRAHVQALHAALPTAKAPAVVIWGTQDKFLSVAHAETLQRLLPNARTELYDPCGHLPQIECAARFNQAALDFWGELDRRDAVGGLAKTA